MVHFTNLKKTAMKVVTIYRSQKSKFPFAMTKVFANAEPHTMDLTTFLKWKGEMVIEKTYRLSYKKSVVSEKLFNKYAHEAI